MSQANTASCLALAGVALLGSPASAACNFGTSPQVTAPNLSFGTYSFSSNSDASHIITARCASGGSVPPLTLNLSTGSSGTYFSRMLYNASDTLNYNIYTDPAHTTVYGDGTSGTQVFTYGGGSANTVSGTVFLRVASGQPARTGTYSDSIVMTIVY